MLGDRDVFWCRELTKMHEEFTRDALSIILSLCKDKKIKGESVFIIAGAASEPEISDTDIKELLKLFKKSGGKSLRDAVRSISTEHRIARSTVYKQALKIWEKI